MNAVVYMYLEDGNGLIGTIARKYGKEDEYEWRKWRGKGEAGKYRPIKI